MNSMFSAHRGKKKQDRGEIKIQKIMLQAAVIPVASSQSSTQTKWDVSESTNRNKILAHDAPGKKH